MCVRPAIPAIDSCVVGVVVTHVHIKYMLAVLDWVRLDCLPTF